MDFKKDTKGFTLIELLAVIVILAIIILVATSNVGGMTQTARKNVLALEGNTLVDSAKEAYQIAVLNGEITTGDACFSLQYLYQEGYYSKDSTSGYQGSVLVTAESDKLFSYKFWISDKNYVLSDAESGATGSGATKVTDDASKASKNCNNASVQKLYLATGETA
jgi:type IV pilus assembly protein PilA